ncbi:50S ribosomal protein L4 [Thermodesulfobacteriota bacterium]
MTTINIYNMDKEKTSQMEINEKIFNIDIKKHLLHQVVVNQLNNQRRGCASTKSRSEIKGSGMKLWRQKGTGRARVGAASSPTRRGGGVAFGPSPKKYFKKTPKKVRKAVLSMALSDKFKSDRLIVLENFNLTEIKTKKFVKVMKNFEINKALIITDEKNENLEKSSQNVPWAKVMRYEGLNVYDILNHEHLFMVQAAVNLVEEALIR